MAKRSKRINPGSEAWYNSNIRIRLAAERLMEKITREEYIEKKRRKENLRSLDAILREVS